MGTIVIGGEKAQKSVHKKPENKKARSDSGYFDSLFASLGPLKYQEVNWKGQKYASAVSAYGSILGAAKGRHLNDVTARIWEDRVFVYKYDFLGILPWEEKDIAMSQMFNRAAQCLNEHADIEQWPIPAAVEARLAVANDKTAFQIGMELRSKLKEEWPYLTVSTNKKGDLVIIRDKLYGGLAPKKTVTSGYVDATGEQATVPKTVTVASTSVSDNNQGHANSDVTFAEHTNWVSADELLPEIVDIPISISLELATKLAEEFMSTDDPNWKIFVSIDLDECLPDKKLKAKVKFVHQKG